MTPSLDTSWSGESWCDRRKAGHGAGPCCWGSWVRRRQRLEIRWGERIMVGGSQHDRSGGTFFGNQHARLGTKPLGWRSHVVVRKRVRFNPHRAEVADHSAVQSNATLARVPRPPSVREWPDHRGGARGLESYTLAATAPRSRGLEARQAWVCGRSRQLPRLGRRTNV